MSYSADIANCANVSPTQMFGPSLFFANLAEHIACYCKAAFGRTMQVADSVPAHQALRYQGDAYFVCSPPLHPPPSEHIGMHVRGTGGLTNFVKIPVILCRRIEISSLSWTRSSAGVTLWPLLALMT